MRSIALIWALAFAPLGARASGVDLPICRAPSVCLNYALGIGALPITGGTLTGPLTVAGTSVTANAFFGDGSHLTGISGSGSQNTFNTTTTFNAAMTVNAQETIAGSSLTLTGPNGYVTSSSSINASAFFGDGSHLTGIQAGGTQNTFNSSTTFNAFMTVSNSSINMTGPNGYLTSASSVNASAFFGNGARLTGIPSTGSIVGVYVLKSGDKMTGNLEVHSASLTVNGPFTSTGTNGGILFSGAGTRMFWVPQIAAFRAGIFSSSAGDPGSVGSASVAFGQDNLASGAYTAISGGVSNFAGQNYDSVGGGNGNTANGGPAVVAGGQNNNATGNNTSIGGGLGNSAGNSGGHIGGGVSNAATGINSSVGGGYQNSVDNEASTVGGGSQNTASGQGSVTAGGGFITTTSNGAGNQATALWASILGGQGNLAQDEATTVGGGEMNTSLGAFCTIAGGASNAASGLYSTISGGLSNISNNSYSTVGGGVQNSATGEGAFVGGGEGNTASGMNSAVVGGGSINTGAGFYPGAATGDYSIVGGGYSNTADGTASVVAGGATNKASNPHDTVSGGANNTASGTDSTVGGGNGNIANGNLAVIAGGNGNQATASQSAVGGGTSNIASGQYSYVGAGFQNTASAQSATIAGGTNNTASAFSTFAAGQQAQALHQGSFVWADSKNATLASTTTDQFLIRALGGFRVQTSSVQFLGGTSSFTFTSAGRVGLGTINPGTLLHMSSGTLTVDGTGAAINTTGSYKINNVVVFSSTPVSFASGSTLAAALASGTTFFGFTPDSAITLRRISATVAVAGTGGSGDVVRCNDASNNGLSVTSASGATAGTVTEASGTANIAVQTRVNCHLDSGAATRPIMNVLLEFVTQ